MIPLAESSARWIHRACAELEELLLDHAHCEKRAASTALGFLFRHAEHRELVLAMSRVAREELLHFERLQEVLRERGIRFRRQVPSEYAGKLARLQRTSPSGKAVDELLVACMIEARSTERFGLLARSVVDPGLRALFAELAEAEARHAELYVELAAGLASPEEAARRLADLTRLEAGLLETPQAPLRLHAG
jgi:tRNA 2-(methylsulfanyl)-N6-isopentenyladenosine37 hydroxylase